ncbi:hypothetical protein B0H13DRAFT_1884137 [Mycena leptocephala]|nr:hypothetical protein B0H13DRAFT_1884137 [Mycena leptocephala]
MKMDSLQRSFPDRSRSPLNRRTLRRGGPRGLRLAGGVGQEHRTSSGARLERSFPDRSRSPLNRRTLKTERISKTSSGAPRRAESVIDTEHRQEHGQWHSLDNENGQLGEIVPRPQPQPAQQAHTEDGEDEEGLLRGWLNDDDVS